MRRDNIIEIKGFLIISGLLVALLVLGSFMDLAISQVLVINSSVFQIIDAYMKLPLTACISFIGLFIISQRNCQNMVKNIGMLVLGLIVIAIGIGVLTYYTFNVVSSNLYICLAISAVLNILCITLLYRLIHDSETEEQKRFVSVIVTVLIIGVILTYGLHYFWNRPSYLSLIENESLVFQKWWQIGNPIANIMASDELQFIKASSFPSVSALSLSLLLLLPLFARVNRKYRYGEQFFLGLGFILAIIFGFISVISGLSYVSDISITMLVMCIVEVITIKRIYNE